MRFSESYVSEALQEMYPRMDRIMSRRFGVSAGFPKVTFEGGYRGGYDDPLGRGRIESIMQYSHTKERINVSLDVLNKGHPQTGEFGRDDLLSFFGHEEGHRRHDLFLKRVAGSKGGLGEVLLSSNPHYRVLQANCWDMMKEAVAYHAQILSIDGLGLYSEDRIRPESPRMPTELGFGMDEFKGMMESFKEDPLKRDGFWRKYVIIASKRLAERMAKKSGPYFRRLLEMEPQAAVGALVPAARYLEEGIRSAGPGRFPYPVQMCGLIIGLAGKKPLYDVI